MAQESARSTQNPVLSFQIRPARPRDLEWVAAVEAASFPAPWSLEAFRSLIGRPRVHFLVAELDPVERVSANPAVSEASSGIVGHGILWCASDEAELANLAVQPAFRKRRVAGALVDRLLDEAECANIRSVCLEVRASNEAATLLYLGRGFRQVGLRKHYYDEPREDARVLRLSLCPGHCGSPS